MYQGKRTQARKLSRLQKYLLLGAVLALVLAVSVSVTVAFLIDNDNTVTNTFTPGEVKCSISENFSTIEGVKYKSEVKVTNDGNIPAYIRVAVVANKVDEAGNIVAGAASADFTLGAGWAKSGDYYYYTSTVEPNTSTNDLLGSNINLSGIQVTILAEAIQADGKTGETLAVVDAWGVNPTSLTGGANG